MTDEITKRVDSVVSAKIAELLQKGYVLQVFDIFADSSYTVKTFPFVKGDDTVTVEIIGGYYPDSKETFYTVETKDGNNNTVDEVVVKE